jgi:hypothetical protein
MEDKRQIRAERYDLVNPSPIKRQDQMSFCAAEPACPNGIARFNSALERKELFIPASNVSGSPGHFGKQVRKGDGRVETDQNLCTAL